MERRQGRMGGRGRMGSEKVRTMAETTEAESQPKGSAKARTMGSLKAALTATVPAKASRKEPLKAGRIAMEPGKMMALLKAPWKSTVSVKEPTKAGPTELASRLMASQKVWTMTELTEPESPQRRLQRLRGWDC